MPSIQVTGQLVDPTKGVEGSADIRIASVINYGQTTKKSISHKSTDASGNYDFQLVYGKHLIFIKYEDERIYIPIGYAVVSDSTPDPIDLIQLINLSDENPPSELVTELQQLREDTLNDIVYTSAQVLENAGYQGEWISGTSTALKGETWQVSGRYYVALKNTSVDPINDNDNWREVVNTESVTTAQNDIVGGSIFKGSNGEHVQNGDTIPSQTPPITHLRVLAGGEPTLVKMSIIRSGLVTYIDDNYATIDGADVYFFKGLENSDSLTIRDFGFKPGVTTDATAAILRALQYAQGKRIYIDFEHYTYVHTMNLPFDQVWIKSSGAVLKKSFNGEGVTITGGSYYFRLRGDLRFEGAGDGYADGQSVSTNPTANGVGIHGCRLDIIGRMESVNHQGYAFDVNANGNMNTSNIYYMLASQCNKKGFNFRGTQDDCSVWNILLRSRDNYEGGVEFADDFSGRQWKGTIYNEASNNPSGDAGVKIGKLRSCEDLAIYSEEQTLTGPEIEIGANCDNLKIVSMRNGRDLNYSVETCSIVSGNGGLWSNAGVAYDIPSRSTAVTDDVTKFIAKRWYGSSNHVLNEVFIKGNGEYERQLNARTGPVGIDYGMSPTLGAFDRRYGAPPQRTTFYYEGTRDTPADIAAGPINRDRYYAQISGVLRELISISYNLDQIITNRGVASVTVGLANNTLSPEDVATIHANGDVELLKDGSGLIAKSPDGSRYRLSPPNGGGTATWVAV